MERPSLPQFERTGVNEAGYPILERVRLAHQDSEQPESIELSSGQVHRLRLVLAVVGALGIGVGAKYTYDYYAGDNGYSAESDPHQIPDSIPHEYSEADSKQEEETSPFIQPETSGAVREEVSQTEAVQGKERYERALSGYRAQFLLGYDEVLFVNEENAPVGNPIKISDVSAQYHDSTPAAAIGLNNPYDPGPLNDIGLSTEGIRSAWLDFHARRVQEQYPDEVVARRLHVTQEFNALFQSERFPELAEQIRAGHVRTHAQLVAYFMNQPFPDSAGLNRFEYAVQYLSFRDTDLHIPIAEGEVVRRAVPPEVQAVFRSVFPGLVATESLFQDEVTHPVTLARGPAQILPSTWHQYTNEDEVDTSYVRQVAVWGEIMSDFYNSVQERIGDGALSVLRSRFSVEESFQSELVARLALNAYNAGPARVAEVVRAYVNTVAVGDMPTGADLYLAIAEFGRRADNATFEGSYLDGFDEYASTYVLKSEAAAAILAHMQPSPMNRTGIEF